MGVLGPIPSELTVSLRDTTPGALPGGPTIASAGDSVVAAAVLPSSRCDDFRARAGMAGGVLVITIVDSLTDRLCNTSSAQRAFVATVRPAPSGHYAVVLRQRFLAPPQAPAETEVVRRAVTVP